MNKTMGFGFISFYDYQDAEQALLNIQNASALVTYTTDAFKEVNINEIEKSFLFVCMNKISFSYFSLF